MLVNNGLRRGDIRKIFKFEEGSRDHNKIKETSSQLKPVRNGYV